MIYRKNLIRIFEDYCKELLGFNGQSEIKHQGEFHRIYPILAPMPTITKEVDLNPTTHIVKELRIRTGFSSSHCIYKIWVHYPAGKFNASFKIASEAFNLESLLVNFTWMMDEFEQSGLLKLTPEEEYEQAVSDHAMKVAEAYGIPQYMPAPKTAGKWKVSKPPLQQTSKDPWGINTPHKATNYIVQAQNAHKELTDLKNEIETLKKSVWVVKDPNGIKSTASPDQETQILHSIMQQVQNANNTAETKEKKFHTGLKALTEAYFKEHGEFPGAQDLMGMKVAFDPGVPDGVIVMHSAQGADVYSNIMKAADLINKMPPPKASPGFKKNKSYDNSGRVLSNLIPALQHTGIPCPAPNECGYDSHYFKNQTLQQLIIHLNDSHRWPRSSTDPNPQNKPNIADWIDEVCLVHGLDQSFHPKGEKTEPPF